MISPMLATLGSAQDVGDGSGWAFEMKWDGIRAVATIDGDRIELRTRNGNNVTVAYPDLGELSAVVDAKHAVLDGEIVALDAHGAHGAPSFGKLQQRMGLTVPAEVERAARDTPVYYLVFDILEDDEGSLLDRTYDERRAALEATVQTTRTGRVQVPGAFAGSLDAAMETSRERHLEGVVAKRRDSRYLAGGRGRAWIKIKHHRTQEVIVGGWRPGNGRRATSIGSLLLGIPDDSGVRYVGRVGTGFSDRVLDEIARDLKPLEIAKPTLTDVPSADARDAHWVEPTRVGEVSFAEWTSAGRLRQPTWRGWRTDKAASDVRIE